MTKVCPTCGKQLQFENAEICPNCGVRIPGTSPEVSPQPHSKKSYYLGIISLFAWLLPIVGLPISIIGLYLGNKELKNGVISIVQNGILFSTIGLILSIVNAFLGVLMYIYGLQ